MVVLCERGKQPQGSMGALAQLADAPLGTVRLTALALELAACAFWQRPHALSAPEYCHDGLSVKRLVVRPWCQLSDVLHAVLVGDAAWRLFGFGRPAGMAGRKGGGLRAICSCRSDAGLRP